VKTRSAFVCAGVATLTVACVTKPAVTNGTGPLILEAYAGPAGEVAADVLDNEPGVGPNDTCGSAVVAGACQLTACSLTGGVGDPGLGYGNYGPILVIVDGAIVPMPYQDEGYPTIGFPSSVALGTGGKMTFQGQGGTTDPGFDVTATIPGPGVITSPALVAAATTIDTAQDLTVTWTPIDIGVIQFSLSSGDELSSSVYVACTFDGSAGSGVVSQSLLSMMKTMSGADPTMGSLSSEADTTTVIDGLTITTQAYNPAASGGFNVTFE
jgi:hypothetical protein